MPGSALSITHARPLLLVDDSQDDVDLTLRALQRVALAHPIQVARDGDEVTALMRGWESGDLNRTGFLGGLIP